MTAEVICPDCNSQQYGWDGLERHYLRGWCKVTGKLSEEDARYKVNTALQAVLDDFESNAMEQQMYDFKHGLGMYSY